MLRRFQRVHRQQQPDFLPCRGTELSEDHIAAHLAVQSTFATKNEAKSTMTTTSTAVFGGVVWDAMNDEELKKAYRLYSAGVISLEDYVDVALEAYGANDGTTPVFESMGATLIKAGLASVDEETGTCVDGPRIAAARAILGDQGYTDDSNVMRSLNIETILVIWLNLVQADPKCKFRLPDFVYASRAQKSRERLALTSPTARRWAHCLWGAFGAVAPEVFVGLADVYWALGAGRMCLLPRLNALDAGEVPAGGLFVLESAVDEVRANSPAGALLTAAIARDRAAANYFATPRTARVGGRRPPARIILAGDRSDLARTVRSRYRELLVFDLLAAQGRDDLVKGGDVTRLSAFQAELARDARDAAAAPTDAGGAAPAADGLQRVVTFSCVVQACATAYPAAEVAAMEKILHDDVAKERVLQDALFDALKTDDAFDVVVVLRGVRSYHGAPPGVLAVLKTRIDTDDTLSTKGLQAEDNTGVFTSPFALLTLAAANIGRTNSVDGHLVPEMKGFGKFNPDGTRHKLGTYLWTTLRLGDDSNLLGSVHWSGAALNRRTGQLFRTYRRGRTGFDPLDALAAAHTRPHRRLSSGDRDEDLRRYIRTSSQPRNVATLRCVLEKLAEAERFKQARAEAAAKTDADAAAARDRAAAQTSAGAGGPLEGTTFVIAGHGTAGRIALLGAGAFSGRESLYADADALARLLRDQGAVVYDLAVEPRSSDIYRSSKHSSLTLAQDSRAVMVLSDGYTRPAGQPPKWLDCFKTKGRAVKESYVRALADAGFDFDGVGLAPHLAYEPGTHTPRAI